MKYLLIIVLIAIYFLWQSGQPGELYFDNNATTRPHALVQWSILRSGGIGNASSFYSSEAKNCIEHLKRMILIKLNKPDHICIITSGASESNNLLLRGFSGHGRLWCSPFEHKSVLECVKELGGTVSHRFFPKSGDLVSQMAVNNETGDLFNIWAIAKKVKQAGAYFHTDITQFFGKITDETFADIDCFSMSFHKLYMLPGIGALVVPKDFPLKPQISGTQNNGLRGGTECTPLCIGTIKTLEITFNHRLLKNAHLQGLCCRLKSMLEKYRRAIPMSEFIGLSDKAAYLKSLAGPPALVYINIPGTAAPINTVLVSFVNNTPGSRFCNIKFREEATQKNVKISIGSACNTSVAGPSHILTELKLPFVIRAGVIRFSFGDYNTADEIDELERRLFLCYG